MAFGQIQQSANNNSSNQSFERFVGVRNVKVIAVNPTEAELNATYGGEQKPIEYKTTDRDGNDQFNIVFILKSTSEDGNLYRKYFTISKETVKSKAGDTLCIDKYGRTAYINKDLLEAKKKPEWAEKYPETSSIGISSVYRPAYQGERELIAFIKAYLGIRDRIWDQDAGMFVDNKDMASRECFFDDFKKLAKGDITELQAIFANSINDPKNDSQYLKVMLGVRTKDDKLYSVIYPNVFLPWHARASKSDGMYYEFKRALINDAEAGVHADTEYSAKEAVSYVAPTSITSQSVTMSEYLEESTAAPAASIDDDELPF